MMTVQITELSKNDDVTNDRTISNDDATNFRTITKL